MFRDGMVDGEGSSERRPKFRAGAGRLRTA
jgi:hypothetical protein